MRTCTEPGCDRRYSARGLCKSHYWARYMRSGHVEVEKATKEKAAALVEDVEFLLTVGESPCQIANRFGVKPSSVARRLYRWGRDDLARPFYRVAA